MNNIDDRIKLALYLMICIFAIVTYGTFRCKTPGFIDPCTKSIVGDNYMNRYIDGWGLLHFWFFAMLCYLYPKYWKWLVIAGIIWEIIEMIFKEHPFYLADCHVDIETDKEGWWYGRWEDIIMNSFGMVCGLFLLNRRVPFYIFPMGFAAILILQFSL